MQKRIAVIGCAGIPANYGGFETLVENLVKVLGTDFKFIVYCSSFAYTEKIPAYYNAQLIYIPIRANGRSSILYDVVSILRSINRSDILLVLGVGGAFLFPFIRIFSKKNIIVNIDGLEWKRQKWGVFARFYLMIQERIAVKFAHKVIADNEVIQAYIKEQYKRESFYAPYGGDHVQGVEAGENIKRLLGRERTDYFFSVCRIEPENNIHVILKAFAAFPELKLVIVGNWNASRYGKSLVEQYQKKSGIFLLDPIYDLAILDELRSNCCAYVHGHSAGGTNPSLVEAMNLGLAILAWDVPYNRHTTENKALYFKDCNELQVLLTRVKNDAIDLTTIAHNLRIVAEEKYSWQQVADRYRHLFAM